MKLLMLKGLPGSGKSTFAKELAKNPDWKRVNKDELRLMIDAGVYSKENELILLKARNSMVKIFLSHNYNVVVDDTNFNHVHQGRLEYIAESMGAEFEVKFFDVSPEECIRRDALRPAPVGEKVIWDMHNKYLSKV